MAILLIDNFDSFAHNLARYFRLLGHVTKVVRGDCVPFEQLESSPPAAIVISPGPKTPDEAGDSLEVVRRYSGRVPLLGVCLGHQTIGRAFGGTIIRAEPMHGRSSQIAHCGESLFAGLPSPLTVARYHSLVIAPHDLPTCLAVDARSEDGLIMAVHHREHPTYGVQFHPESVLTPQGFALLRNFLELAGLTATPIDDVVANLSSFANDACPVPNDACPVPSETADSQVTL